MHQNAEYQNMRQCMHHNIHVTFEFYTHSWQLPWVLSEANSIFLVITTKILPRWSLPSKIYIYAFFFCFLKRSNLFCFQTLYLFFLLSCHLYMKILWYICIHRYYLLLIIKKVFIVDSLLETRRYLIINQFWCINTNS